MCVENFAGNVDTELASAPTVVACQERDVSMETYNCQTPVLTL